MLKNNRKTKKGISLIILFVLFFVEIFPVQASLPSLEEIAASFNDDSSTVSAVNSSNNDPSGISKKMKGPTVTVNFSTNGIIKPGAKVTANAIPGYFTKDKLYYTWYLKRANCGLTDGDDPGSIDDCDEDKDGKITENDWKLTAAKIIVKGSFDSINVSYSKIEDKVLTASSYEAFPNFKKEGADAGWRKYYVEDGNGDIYTDNDENVTDCYVQAPKSGNIYELRQTEERFNDSCPPTYHRACISNTQASCLIHNPEYIQADADAAANAIPPVPYTIPKGIIDPVDPNIPNDASTSLFNACAVSSEQIGNNKANDSCVVTDMENFETGVSCGENSYSICMNDDLSDIVYTNENSVTKGIIFGKIDNDKMCSALAKPYDIVNKIFQPNTDPVFTGNIQDCKAMQDGLINGIKDDFGKIKKAGNKELAPKCEFEKGPNLCKHLFPRLPKDVRNEKGGRAVSGDGEFNTAEKAFWKLDPNNPSTNGSGKADEETTTGLGVDKFEWLYSAGDKVGVVVEGDSILTTQHNDAGYKRMWAFSKGTCEALNDIEKNSKISFYKEGTDSISYGFLTANVDLNDCLEENLLDPDSEGISKLSVQLTSSPQNPINDPNGRGDTLNIVASAANLDNPDGLLYKWSVQKSTDGSSAPIDNTGWVDVTNKLVEYGSFNESDKEGLGKSNLNINLNLKNVEDGMIKSYNGIFYLKIKAKIIGTGADGNQTAEGFIVVRIKQQENEMVVYPTSASDSGMLSFNKGLSGSSNELCSDDQGKQRCFVGKNQIIALEVVSPENNKLSDFIWKVNGTEVTCSENISTSCVIKGNKMFIPILGNEGEAIDVVAAAMNQKKEQMEISRHFVIGSSQLQIIASDPNVTCSLQCLDSSSVCPKYLGHYNDLNGNQYPDCSTQVLETRQGNTVTLGTYGQTGFDWAVDGQIMTEYQDKDQIQLVINKNPGDSYNIGLATRVLPGGINQKNNIRKALYKNWGVSPDDVTEENQSANIQLNVVDGVGQSLASNQQKSLAASLITHLPEQLIFLFKIFLTSATLLISMSLLFALMPEAAFREED